MKRLREHTKDQIRVTQKTEGLYETDLVRDKKPQKRRAKRPTGKRACGKILRSNGVPSVVTNNQFNKTLHLISRSASSTTTNVTDAKQVNVIVERNRSSF